MSVLDDLAKQGFVDLSEPPQAQDPAPEEDVLGSLQAAGFVDMSDPPSEEDAGSQDAGVWDWVQMALGPPQGRYNSRHAKFSESRRKVYQSMGYQDPPGTADEGGEEEEPAQKDEIVDLSMTSLSDRIAHKRLTRQFNPDGDESKQQEIDQALQDVVLQRHRDTEAAREAYAETVTISGTPLKESWLYDAPLPARRFFMGVQRAKYAAVNTGARLFGYKGFAHEKRNALNNLGTFNSITDETSIVGRDLGPTLGQVVEEITVGSVGMGPTGAAALYAMEGFDSGVVDAANAGKSGIEQAKTGLVHALIQGAGTYYFAKGAKKLGLDPGDGLNASYLRNAHQVGNRGGLYRPAASGLLEAGEEVVQEAATAWEEWRSGVDPHALDADKLRERLVTAASLGGAVGSVSSGVNSFLKTLRKVETDAPKVVEGTREANADYKQGKRGSPDTRKMEDEALAKMEAYEAEFEALKGLEDEYVTQVTPLGETREQVEARKVQAEEFRTELESLQTELNESWQAYHEGRLSTEAGTPVEQTRIDPTELESRQAEINEMRSILEREQKEIDDSVKAIEELDNKVRSGDKDARVTLEEELNALVKKQIALEEEITAIDELAGGAGPAEVEGADTEGQGSSVVPEYTPTRTQSGTTLPADSPSIVRSVLTNAAIGAVAGSALGPSGVAVGGGVGVALGLSPILGHKWIMDRSNYEALRDNANSIPGPSRGRARGVAQDIEKKARDVNSWERRILARLQETRSPMLKKAGGLLWSRYANEAQNTSREVDHGGVTAGTSVLTDALEGRVPLRDLSPELADFVKQVRGLHQNMADMAQNEFKHRQKVPEYRREARVAELQQMTTEQLQKHHQELLPNHAVPSSRGALIDRLSDVRFFTPFKDGMVKLRIKTEVGQQIFKQGSAHPLYEPLVQWLAAENGLELQEARDTLAPYTGAASRKAATEVPRLFEKFPDYIVDENGRRQDILESAPFDYVQRATESFATSSANIQVFGQEITTPGNKSNQDLLLEEALKSGLDPGLIDATFDSVAGISPDSGVAPDIRIRSAIPKALVNIVRASQLSQAGLYSLTEPLGNANTYAGTRRVAKAYQAWLPKQMRSKEIRDAEIAAERMGLITENAIDLTLNRGDIIGSIGRIWGAGNLAISRAAWKREGKQTALVAVQVAEDLKNGRGMSTDRYLLEDVAGYTPAEATRLLNREGTTDKDYDEVARRVASNLSMTDLTTSGDKSPFEKNKMLNVLFAYLSYPLHRMRTTERFARRLSTSARNLIQNPSPEASKEFATQIGRFGVYTTGVTASGAVAVMIRNMLNFGAEEGLKVSWAEATDDPHEFVTSAFRMGMVGPIIDNVLYSLEQNGEVNAMSAIPLASPLSEAATGLVPALTGGSPTHYAYKDRSAVEATAQFFYRHTAPKMHAKLATRASEIDAIAPVVAPLGLATADEELRGAKARYYEFLRDNGWSPPSFRPDPEDREYRIWMRRFKDSLGREDNPERAEYMSRALFNAFKVSDKDPAAFKQAVLGRRILNTLSQVPDSVQQEYRRKYPEDFKKLRDHDFILQSWANYID